MFVIKLKYLTCSSGTLGDAAPATTRQFRVPKSHEISTERKKKNKTKAKAAEMRRGKRLRQKKVIDGNCSNCHVYERPQDTKPTERETWGGRRREGGLGKGKGKNCGCNVHAMRQQFCNLEKAPPHTEYAMR